MSIGTVQESISVWRELAKHPFDRGCVLLASALSRAADEVEKALADLAEARAHRDCACLLVDGKPVQECDYHGRLRVRAEQAEARVATLEAERETIGKIIGTPDGLVMPLIEAVTARMVHRQVLLTGVEWAKQAEAERDEAQKALIQVSEDVAQANKDRAQAIRMVNAADEKLKQAEATVARQAGLLARCERDIGIALASPGQDDTGLLVALLSEIEAAFEAETGATGPETEAL